MPRSSSPLFILVVLLAALDARIASAFAPQHATTTTKIILYSSSNDDIDNVKRRQLVTSGAARFFGIFAAVLLNNNNQPSHAYSSSNSNSYSYNMLDQIDVSRTTFTTTTVASTKNSITSSSLHVADGIKTLDMTMPTYGDIKGYKASIENTKSLEAPVTKSVGIPTSKKSASPVSNILPSVGKKGPKPKKESTNDFKYDF